jgi:hypothetical protein
MMMVMMMMMMIGGDGDENDDEEDDEDKDEHDDDDDDSDVNNDHKIQGKLNTLRKATIIVSVRNREHAHHCCLCGLFCHAAEGVQA